MFVGEINLDDLTYNTLNFDPELLRPIEALKDPGTRHYALVFEIHQCYFQWGGNEAATSYLFRTHIDTQARNLERLLGTTSR